MLEALSLRLYVRHSSGVDVRRDVVFIKQSVTRPAIVLVARLAYNEPYEARHSGY